MEKKFNADLAAKIKEPLTAALTAVYSLATMGYDHVTCRYLGTQIELTVFEDTEEEIQKTKTLLDTKLNNDWKSRTEHRYLSSGEDFHYIEYTYEITE